MIGDVNFENDDEMVVTRPIQWGIRGVKSTGHERGTCGIYKCTGDLCRDYRPYRYIVVSFPIWWYGQDKYFGKGTVHPDGRITYTRVWERLSLLWTEWPGWRFFWVGSTW